MTGEWPLTNIGECLATEFPGEWGVNPGPLPANALVLRSTNLDDEGHVDLAGGAARVIPTAKLTAKQLVSDDILLEASGGGPGKPVGRVAVFADDGAGPYLCSNFFRTLRPKKDVDARFLAWRLQHLYRQPLIWRFQQQTTGIINLKYRDYLNQTLQLPPLPEQRRIAEILDTLDEAIRKTEQVIAKLQQMKQGLLHDLLTRGIDENGELRDPERHPEQFQDSPLGLIPRSWDVQTLGQLVSFITDYRGKTPPYSEEGIAAISAENIGAGRVRSITKWVSSEVYKRWTTRGFPEPGDTIFTTEAPVAEVARLPGDQSYLLTRRVIALRPKPSVNMGFLYWSVLRSAQEGAWAGKMHGSTVPRILKPDILGLAMTVPHASEQESLSARMDAQEARLDREAESLAKLRTLKYGLMDDLLTGRVRVKIPEKPTA
jgi:type I restriction enzyme, S subunit